MIKIGIIGLGHWGPNYIRCFNKLHEAIVVKGCDIKEENLTHIKALYPSINLTTDYRDILKDENIHAIIVATPASTHYKIVKECLEYGKDVLAEKPLTLIPEESLALAEFSAKSNRILMVGHTFLYNPGILKLKEYIKNGELGKIYYMNATRTHLGLIREDVNAIWDLAPHDVSIFNFLTDKMPISINAIGACHLKEGREDVAFINLIYPDNIIASIHVSWADSNKERTIRVVGSNARATFNDLDNLEMIKLYKKGIAVSEKYDDFGGFQLNLRDGDIISPKLTLYEPLSQMCSHFFNSLKHRTAPLTDGYFGYNVVKIMKTIEDAILENGRMT